MVGALADDRIKVVNLSQTLRSSTPIIQLPPDFAPTAPFRIEQISHYDELGPAWYWNNISCGEHTGTHFDAPAHWVSGKGVTNGTTDTIPVGRFIAPACVIDCSKGVAADESFVLEPAHIEAFEAAHVRSPDHPTFSAHRAFRPLAGMCGSPATALRNMMNFYKF